MPALKNSQHERLCYEVASGCSHAEAARRAGYSEKCARINVHTILQRKDVAERLKELRELSSSESVMCILARKEELTQIARDERIKKPHIAIAAIAELNKMDGAYAPTRIETSKEEVIVKTLAYFAPDGTRLLEGPNG